MTEVNDFFGEHLAGDFRELSVGQKGAWLNLNYSQPRAAHCILLKFLALQTFRVGRNRKLGRRRDSGK